MVVVVLRRGRKKAGRLIAPASNGTAGYHPRAGEGVGWAGVGLGDFGERWGRGRGDASLMLHCLLTQQTQRGAFHQWLAARPSQLNPALPNVER